MNKNKSIGIIGGYSNIGKIITQYLIRNTDRKLLIGGRNAALHTEWANSLNERVMLMKVDYNSEEELQSFCSKCAIIINAAGPSLIIVDRIAIAALRCNCHYIDIGGYNSLYNRLTPHINQITGNKLCFILGAGWMPGISGLIPLHCLQRATSETIDVKEICLYYGAVEAWSYGSCYDLAASSRESRFSLYRNGKKEIIKSVNCSHRMYFPEINMKKTCYPLFDDQLEKCANEINADKFVTYALMNDFRSTLAYLSVRTIYRNKPQKAAKAIQKDSLRLQRKEGSWGLLNCVIKGIKNELEVEQKTILKVTDNMLPTALPSALAAQWIVNNKIPSGLDYLCYSVDADPFLSELKKYGIDYQTTIKVLN